MSNKAPPKEGAALVDSDCSAKNARYANNDNAKHLANKKQIGSSVHSINANNCRSESVVHIKSQRAQARHLRAKKEESQAAEHSHQPKAECEREEQEWHQCQNLYNQKKW